MSRFRRILRKTLSWSHRWLGLVGGILFFVIAFSGGIVTFRPQVASFLSPPAPKLTHCVEPVDWNAVERQVEQYADAPINRIYAPTAPDTRYRFRMMTDRSAIYEHVIFDACSGHILGKANLAWMDWLVDFHHNLRADRTGRWYAGWMGAGLLLSGVGGLFLWLISSPSVQRLLKLRSGPLLARDLHTSAGVTAGLLLTVASLSSLWLCFPDAMEAVTRWVMPLPEKPRLVLHKPETSDAPFVGLGDLIDIAERAISGAEWHEIRLPQGYGNVRIRMWLPGDFRSLGNNVVSIDRATGASVVTDDYSSMLAGPRFVDALAGLHYGEWGGIPYRLLYGTAGLLSPLIFATGFLTWWLPRRRRNAQSARPLAKRAEAASRAR